MSSHLVHSSLSASLVLMAIASLLYKNLRKTSSMSLLPCHLFNQTSNLRRGVVQQMPSIILNRKRLAGRLLVNRPLDRILLSNKLLEDDSLL
jgi:hypothetical protein